MSKVCEQVDYVLAGNPNTPSRVLDRLVTAGQPRVRRQLAENPALSREAIVRLAADENVEVVATAAVHPALPRPVLEALIAHDSIEVRYAIASDPTVPAEVLLSLVDDENPYVSLRAIQTIRATMRSILVQLLNESARRSRPLLN